MIIDCTSDFHGSFPELEGGDLLIIAGDLTATDSTEEYLTFFGWLSELNYRKKIIIAGNHDGLIEEGEVKFCQGDVISYLCDSGVEFEGLKIWGSPYTPAFFNWSFMADRGEDIKKHWDLIPDDTDILITHGPPWAFLDNTKQGERAGCMDLLNTVAGIRPKLHVFGHIHGGYGEIEAMGTRFVNCAHMDEDHEPVNKPIRIIL